MTRSATSGVRFLCIVVGALFALTPLLLQPSTAGAQAAPVSITKTVCNLTTTGGCPPSNTATTATAAPGNIVQYNLNYVNNTGVTTGIMITDQLQPGQSPGQCAFIAGMPGTCSPNATNPLQFFATAAAVPAGGSGTVALQVQITSTASGTITNAAAAGATAAPGTSISNTTAVTVSGVPGPGTSCLTVSKSVADLTRGGGYGTSAFAAAGDLLRYQITVTNNCATALSPVTISDPIQGGQSVSGSPCYPVTCAMGGGNTLTFTTSLPPGGSTAVTFDASISPVACGSTIPNTATASATGVATGTSNTTAVSVTCGPPPCVDLCPPPPCGSYCGPPPTCGSCGVPPPCGGYCGFPGGVAGPLQVCGVVSAYTAATGSNGYLTMNGETFTLMPNLVPSGAAIAVGVSICVSLTVGAGGLVSGCHVYPNVAGVNYACGAVSPYQQGYYNFPTGGYPYPGYNPYPGTTVGPYPYPGNPGMYGWGGPMVIGGYPFGVNPGTYFPDNIQYGNPYCFTMAPACGCIQTTISVVVVAATPADRPAAIHRSGRHLAL